MTGWRRPTVHAQLENIFLRAVTDAAFQTFGNKPLQLCRLVRTLLIAADQITDIVACVAVAPRPGLGFHPLLHRVGQGSGFSSARSHGSFKQLNSFHENALVRLSWPDQTGATSCKGSRGRQCRPRSRAPRCYGASTKFTSRPGTTISFSTVFPVNLERTSGSSAASLTSSSAASVEGA